MLRQDVELVQELGAPVQEIRSIGGGARSPLWLQIKADVLQRPVATLACEEVACLGAAMLAATATRPLHGSAGGRSGHGARATDLRAGG